MTAREKNRSSDWIGGFFHVVRVAGLSGLIAL